MPFFPKKTSSKEEIKETINGIINNKTYMMPQFTNTMEESNEKQKLIFHCQQAQGSPTGVITGFSNVKELYQRISECYDFEPREVSCIHEYLSTAVNRKNRPNNMPYSSGTSVNKSEKIPMNKARNRPIPSYYTQEILFCTLNTHKINMNKLLGAQIALGDFIFVHRKGRPKEIELKKTENALGLTITDNGNGLAFIKRIKEGSVIDQVPVIQVGDHIEKINNENLVGKRHFEVAKILRDIPLGSTFTLRLISPLQAGFSNIGPRGERTKGKKINYGSGKETLRFRASGEAVVEELDDKQEKAVEGINAVLENFIGINDSELATRIWELSIGIKNSVDFAEVISNSDVEELCFTDEFVIELWGVITDARDGRL